MTFFELLLFPLAYSISKALTDLRKDTGHENIIYRFCVKLGNFLGRNWIDWYDGGNDKYNPSLIWTADFWHLFEHIKTIVISYLSIRVINIYYSFNTLIDVLLFVLVYALIGQFFELFYRYILPDKKAGSILDWLKKAILFWKNYHK